MTPESSAAQGQVAEAFVAVMRRPEYIGRHVDDAVDEIVADVEAQTGLPRISLTLEELIEKLIEADMAYETIAGKKNWRYDTFRSKGTWLAEYLFERRCECGMPQGNHRC